MSSAARAQISTPPEGRDRFFQYFKPRLRIVFSRGGTHEDYANLVVDRIEPCLGLWIERLGFEKTVEVPEGDHVGFVILQKDEAEVMLQTLEGVRNDLNTKPELGNGSSTLFIEVSNFADLRNRVAGLQIAVPERVTFYGMREIGINHAGHLLIFASKEEAQHA